MRVSLPSSRVGPLPALLALLLACSDSGPERVAGVRLDASTLELRVGATRQLTASAVTASGSTLADRAVAWSSSDAAVATVSGTGLVTARAPGSARIAATVEGASAAAAVTVTLVPVARLALGADALSLVVGQAQSVLVAAYDSAGGVLAGRPVAWRSSDEGVATVSAAGVVTAVAAGSARVSASVEGREASLAVTVVPRSATTVVTPLASLVLAPGLPWTLQAEVRDQLGAPMSDAPRSFTTSDPAVAAVSDAGVVDALAAGEATVTVRSGTASVAVPVRVLPARATVAGRLVAAAGASPAGDRASVRVGAAGQEYGASVASDGGFAFDAALPTAATDTVTIVVDAASGSRTHRPVLERVPGALAAARLERPLLVPCEVRLATGSYAGATQVVSLGDAFTRVCANDADANCNSFFPKVWLATGPVLWAEAQLPIPVVLHRAGSSAAIADADSAALWIILRKMEADLGRSLFRPAMPAEVQPIDGAGFSRGAVVVTVDTTLRGFAGWTNWQWGTDLNMLAAKVRVSTPAYLGSSSIVTHEMLHALGFHHTCAWGTVMGGYGCPMYQLATREDAAAFGLAYLVRRAVLAFAPTTNILAAYQGERVLEQQLSLAAPAVAPPRAARVTGRREAVFEEGAP